MVALTDAFNENDMVKKRAFLEGRAQIRNQKRSEENISDKALAGKLFKDCAALSLMLGDISAARDHLWKSGTILADLGLPSGLVNLSLVSPKKALDWLRERDDFINIITKIIENPRETKRDGDDYPYIEQSVESGNNISEFIMLEAVLNKPAKDTDFNLGFLSSFRERVEPRSRSSVGITEMNLRSFTSIVDEISSEPYIESGKLQKLSSSNQRAMQLSILRREALLKDLKEDSWHWKRIPEPAKLIDFDLLMFGSLSFDNFSSTELLHKGLFNVDPFALLPFRAAEALRS